MGRTTDFHPTNFAVGGWAFGRQELFDLFQSFSAEDKKSFGIPAAEGLENSWNKIAFDILNRFIDAKTPRPNLFAIKGAKINASGAKQGDIVGQNYIFTMLLKENPEQDFFFEDYDVFKGEIEYRKKVLGDMGLPLDGKDFKTFVTGRDGLEFVHLTSNPGKAY
ncbi:hypothetical protein AAF712_008443 [Marasmius tenuissimus]|uniref:Uncharacterized protein n=1 Tax=Marasmius tenuissimus TaxID=585030 RepID=A0ABR2ZWF1_9AGAR|nr:hypothetical protein PM082_009779 [Marasmius tenuissimus]